MTNTNYFNDPAFSFWELSNAISRKPVRPTQIGDMKLFIEKPITTTHVYLDFKDFKVALFEQSPRGGPGQTVERSKRATSSIQAVHFQRDESLYADQVQNVRGFGTSLLMQLKELLFECIQNDEDDLEMTIERQRLQALCGEVEYMDGEVLNLYEQFKLPKPPVVNCRLTDSNAPLKQIFTDLKRDVQRVSGYPNAKVHCLCSERYLDILLQHPYVEQAYLNTIRGPELLKALDEDRSVRLFGIDFERYEDSDVEGFMGEDEARFFPKGVPLYHTKFAPADYNETVNKPGLPKYLRQWRREDGKGIDYQLQSNPISYCTRPEALRQGRIE